MEVAAQSAQTECDAKLARYRAALEAGTDPTIIAAWTAEVQAQRAAALASVRRASAEPQATLTETEIHAVVEALGNVQRVFAGATAADKATIYRERV